MQRHPAADTLRSVEVLELSDDRVAQQTLTAETVSGVRPRILTRRPFEVPLPREPLCAAIARRLVERHFSLELDDMALVDLKAITTELVEGSFSRGAGTIRLRLQKRGCTVRVEVLDDLSHAWADLDIDRLTYSAADAR